MLLKGIPMSDKTYNVLFICTGNSARSILAEGLLNHLGKGRFKAYSTGSYPTGVVNPLALRALAQYGVPTEGFRSKRWDAFSENGAPELDFVFTVCDKAARRSVSGLAWPAHDGTLGRARSGSGRGVG